MEKSDSNQPQEVKIVGEPVEKSGQEYKVKKIQVERRTLGRYRLPLNQDIYFKTPKDSDDWLPTQMLMRHAKGIQRHYESVRYAFGGHIPRQIAVIGKSKDGRRREIHVYQETVETPIKEALGITDSIRWKGDEEIDGYNERRMKIYEEAKAKTLKTLSNTQQFEADLRRGILKHQEALRKFYEACVESTLMGFVPDLQHLGDKYAQEDKWVGLLFGDNVGISTGLYGKESVMLFDITYPQMDIFGMGLKHDSRKDLRRLIDSKKREGDLPIYSVEVDGEAITTLAPWYEEALKEAANKAGLNSEMVISKIKGALGIRDNRLKDHIFDDFVYPDHNLYHLGKELETFRRLVDAPVYEKPAERFIGERDYKGERYKALLLRPKSNYQ